MQNPFNMKRLLLILAVSYGFIVPGNSQTNVGGVIDSHAVWTKANSPYLVTNPILVSQGVTLTIEPGANVGFESGSYIRVDGELVAEGTESDTITFSLNRAEIRFEGTAVDYDSASNTGCRIKYAVFENSITISNRPDQVSAETNGQVSILISHSVFKNVEIMLYGKGGKDIPEKTVFEDNEVMGGDIMVWGDDHGGDEGSNTIVRRNQFENIHLAAYCGDFYSNSFHNCDDLFFEMGYRDRYSIRNNYFDTQVILLSPRFEFHHNTSVVNDEQDRYVNILGDFSHNDLWRNCQNNNLVGTTKFRYRTEIYANEWDYEASGNYWGTSSLDSANAMVYDFDQDFNLEDINIEPILTSPVTEAPAFIRELTSSSPDTVDSGPVTLVIQFSKPMDASMSPQVRLAENMYTISQELGAGTWSNGNTTYTVTSSDLGSLPPNGYIGAMVSNAQGAGDPLPVPATFYGELFYMNRPAGIDRLVVQPNDTLFSGSVSVRLLFNKPMDTGTDPVITFGSSPPFDQYSFSYGYWNNEQRYYAEYSPVEELPMDVPFTMKVSGAKGLGEAEAVPDQTYSNAFIRIQMIEVEEVVFTPGDTIMEEDLTISLLFSKTMDTEYVPQVRFGGTEPFNTYVFPEGGWSENNTRYTSTLTDSEGLPPFVTYHVVLSNLKTTDAVQPMNNLLLDDTFYRNAAYKDTVRVVVYDTIAVTDTLIIDVELTGTTGGEVNTLRVYPNPARDHVIIHTGDFMKMNGYILKVIDQLGAVVFETNVEGPLYEIDLSTWTGYGLYYIQVVDEGGNVLANRKIILQN